MPRTFVFTGSSKIARKHYQASVETGLPLNLLMPHIQNESTSKKLALAYPDGKAYCWGGKSGGQDQRYWERMEPGDLILGYRDKKIVCAGYLVEKVRSSELAKSAWPDASKNPYDLVYFFTKPEALSKPVADLPDYFGSMYQGLREIRGSALVLKNYGSFQKFIQKALEGNGVGIDLDLHQAEIDDEKHAKEILQRTLEGPVEKQQLIKARRGQGVFRDNVEALESCCRLTRVSNLKYLRASHIKPWRKSTDQEKIDGNNGLMLAPHIDMLFDRGLISFENDGSLIVSKLIEGGVLQSWGIPRTKNVGPFSTGQQKYLKHHREHELKK